MHQFKELHLAHNIEALNRIAINDRAMLSKKPTPLLNAARKLYIKSQSDPLDEEVTYILLYRFIHVFNHLMVIHSDENFVKSMLGKEARTAQFKMNQVKTDLIKRYKEDATKKEEEKAVTPPPALPVQEEKSLLVFNNELFISCLQLFGAFNNKNLDLLILDARSEEDFAESHIKDVKIINIPESCIRSGLSAHKLGLMLPAASKEQWNRRDSFDAIVLLDWNTSKTNYPASKLEKLRSILVEWDPETKYKEKPVVLNEGYLDWLEMFPMLCTTPTVKYSKVNKELDDLLNLDSIEYPTDAEPKSHEVFTPQMLKDGADTSEVNISHEEILEEEKKIIEQNKVVAKELLRTEQQWKDLHTKIDAENDVTELEKLKQEEEQTEEKINKLAQQEEDLIEKKSQLASQFNLAASFKPGELPENTSEKLQAINKLQEEHFDIVKARQAFAEDRQRLLTEARKSKKPQVCEVPPNIKPTINRATKPKAIMLPNIVNHIEGKLAPVHNGLTALINIKNTCYMNTIIQCLRHMPDVIHFYCNGEYTKQVHRSPPIITNEVAHLVRALWSNSYSVIKPYEFYRKFTNLVPVYKQGHHEDCMEFFLQLYNYLSDDCALDISSKNYWSDTQMAWYKQHCGKISFYINMFYHQVRIQYSCSRCRTSNLKFELENIFYLPVPEGSFRLEESMETYLYNREALDCKNCKYPKTARVSLSYYPQVLIIALKRHMQDYNSATVQYRKNEHECYFPVDDFLVGKCTYTLHAIALHSGTVQSGHYTAACLNPTNNMWYLFNDEVVTPVHVSEPSLRSKAYAFFYSMKKDNRNRNVKFEE